MKFVGRRISHTWDNLRYSGTVLSVLSGQDGQASAIYEVLYDNEIEPYEVDQLLQEYMTGELEFLDL